MALTYKILGQSLPAANTYTDLYTVPASTQAILSTINVCNLTTSNVTFRIAARRAGVALTNSQFIAFDTALAAQDSLGLTLGVTLANTDVITVFSAQGNVSFGLFGTEIT